MKDELKGVDLNAELHYHHWREPEAMTDERAKGEIYCEFCGTSLPWHLPACALLKGGQSTKKVMCSFCTGRYLPGDKMHDHVHAEHMDILKQMEKDGLIKLPKK